MTMTCAFCGKEERSVFHRPSSECVYESCEYDLETDDGLPTGNPEKPHPTPHHAFVRKESA